MKFLLISPFSNVSGSAVRFCNIARELHSRGHEVVYVERYVKGTDDNKLDGIDYYTTPVWGNLFIDISLSFLHNFFIFFRHFNCDVYYALKPAPNNCFPALAAKLFGKRIFLDVDDLDYGYFKSFLKRNISKFFFDFFPRFFEIVTCHTETLASYLHEQLNIPRSRLFFLTQGVSSVFPELKDPQKISRRPKTIIYMASLGRSSDFEDIIPVLKNVCGIHPDVSITIVGDGYNKDKYEHAVKSIGLGDNIKFAGRVAHSHMPSLAADHCIGINYMRPSLTNNCRAILKIREYLVLGLQVVCNSTGDADIFKEHIRIGNSLEEFEQLICRELDNEYNFNLNGSRFILDKFSWSDIIAGFLHHTEHINQMKAVSDNQKG